jgi:murein DD-endopeptidase MepM/ murein hydrolase activator NlpD/predicted  nucleic acid-binding Zn-ribbon protein
VGILLDAQRLQGIVDIQGVDQGVAALLKVAHAFDTAAAASATASKQISGFGTAAQGPQSAASGVTALTTATQHYTQTTRARASVDDQLEKTQLRLRLAQTDNAGRVAILRQQYEQLAAAARPLILSQDEITRRTIAATQAAIQLANAEKSVAREQQSQLQAAAGGAGRGVLDGLGASGILGGLGIAGGVAVATRSIINLGTETADLAIKAQTIGTAYEAATKRAGFGADDLLKKLDAAARGTASDTDLMAASNRALALGVGKDTQQIADLLAIARQKGKDFGESTTQAFEDITTGLGRLSPRILDNLGIILDENKIYKEYADAIGVAEGKLSDQEKRQALVNDLIKNNTDLIAKNASAQLDAADKIAAAQAREQAAKERLGQSALPFRVGIENAAANFFELLSGKPQEEARKQAEALALSASSYEDYVKRINAAHASLQPGLNSVAPGFDLQYTPEQFNQIRDLARLGDMAGRTKDDFNGLPAVVQETGKAAALTKDDYDRLGKSLQVTTDQGLKPFKVAVDAAKKSLDDQQRSTAAAKDTVDSISGALNKAKQTYKDFASARLVEDQKYQQQLFDLDQQQAAAEKRLLDFKAPGAGLDQALNPVQAQIDDTTVSVGKLKDQVDTANGAVDDQTRVVQEATDAQRAYDDAVGSAKDNLSAQQDRLSALQDVYDHLGEAIQSAKRDMDDLRHTSLVGEGALDDKLFGMEQNIKRQQLVIDQARLRGAGKDEIKKLTEQLDRLRTAEDAARLAGELRYDKQHRDLEQQGVPRDEQTFEKASHDLGQYQQGVDQLTKAQETAGQAVEDQQKVVSDAKFDLMDATAVQRDHTAAVDAEKAALEKLKESQTVINKQYDDQKTKLGDLKTLLETTRKDALKPFEDEVDEVARRASLARIAEKLEIDPLKRKIEETTASTKLLTFSEIITGITDTNAVIAILEPRLTGAQDILKKEQDATKVLQGVYDQTTLALSAEQTYFDNLKQGLDALQANLKGSKDIWGDLSMLIGAINAANGIGNTGGIPGQQAPFTPQAGATGAGPGYDANAINGVLAKAGSPLAGQGQFIIDMSLKYGIPVEVALAMWKVEGNYGTLGASVDNKNPGNLRGSNLAAGTNGGFALFDTWQAGMEAFFKQLREGSQFGYPQDVDKYKQGDISALLDLIKTYAPAGDNNDPQAYYQSVIAMIKQLLAIITGGTGATAAGGRKGITGNGRTDDDPRPSQYGIDSVVPGAQLGSTFDDWRDYNGNGRVDPNESHYGLDLQIKNGTPVLAPLSLTDIQTGYYPDALRKGWWVTGNDQYGRQWYFGHMTTIFVKAGGSIAKGGTIGTVGMGHVHVQLKQVPGGPPIDPSAALDSAAASGAGPGAGAPDPYTAQTAGSAYQPSRYSVGGPRYGQPIARGLNGVDAAIAGLLPDLHNLTQAVAGVDDATAAAADGIVVATDAILDHIGYKNKDGSGHLSYLNQNGGLDAGAAGNWTRTGGDGMSIGGPHFGAPIATPPEKMQSNDPTGEAIASVGAAVMGLQDTTATTFDGIAKLAPGWKDTWQQFGNATIAEMDGAQRFMQGAELNIVSYIATAEQRIDDLIAKILSIPGIHVHTGPDQHDPSDPANPGGTSDGGGSSGGGMQFTSFGKPSGHHHHHHTQNNTIITRDSDRALRLLRQAGY